MNANHFIIVEIFEKEVNHPLRGKVERQPTKKYQSSNQLSIFLLPKILSRKIICNKICFLKIWACWFLKINCPCNLWKVYWRNIYVCICVQDSYFVHKAIFTINVVELVEKTNSCVLPTLAKNNFTIVSFDLWLSKGTHDIFSFSINFYGSN